MKNRILLVSALALSLSAGLALADDTAGSSAKSRFPGWHNYMEHVISQLPADKAQLYRDSTKKAHEPNSVSQSQRVGEKTPHAEGRKSRCSGCTVMM